MKMTEEKKKDWNEIIKVVKEHLDNCGYLFCNLCLDIETGMFFIEEAYKELKIKAGENKTD